MDGRAPDYSREQENVTSPFGEKKSFSKLLSHTKYEQNRSTFEDAQNFGPNFFDNTENQQPKIKICC